MQPFRERLRLQLVDKLPEFVEVDAGPEPERMGDRLRRRPPSGRSGLAQPGADRAIDCFLERNAEFASPFLQKPREIVVERQGRPHG